MAFFKIHSMQLYFQQGYFLPLYIKRLNENIPVICAVGEISVPVIHLISWTLFTYNSVNNFVKKLEMDHFDTYCYWKPKGKISLHEEKVESSFLYASVLFFGFNIQNHEEENFVVVPLIHRSGV